MNANNAFADTIIEITKHQAPRDIDGRRAWAAKCSNALRSYAQSTLVTRMLTKIAFASAAPANARFVTDVLVSTNQLDLARIFAETADRDARKPWQKRRLKELKEHKASTNKFGRRVAHQVFLSRDGVGCDEGFSHDIETWFREWLPQLESSPVGLLPDPILVYCSSGFCPEVLSRLILLLSCLPVAPVLCFDTADLAAQNEKEFLNRDLTWGWKYQPVIFAARSDPEGYDVLGLAGEESNRPPVAQHLRGLDSNELCGLAVVSSLVWLLPTPPLQPRWGFAAQSLFEETGHFFPRSGRLRLLRVLLTYRFSDSARPKASQVLAGLLLNNGYFDEALGLLESVPPELTGPRFERRMIRALYGVGDFQRLAVNEWKGAESKLEGHQVAEARAAHQMLHELENLHQHPLRSDRKPIPGKVVSILHASQPAQNGGYANRAHQILRGMAAHGLEVVAYTRPGFPEPENCLEPGEIAAANHDGVAYRRIGTKNLRQRGEYEYMRESLKYYRNILEAENPAIVHLRSTYVSALPGLIAAHSLGIPAIYEVSGMWELVYESKDSARMESRRARTIVLENAVLRNADQIMTLTEAMRNIIMERTAISTIPTILPNAVDSNRFKPRPKNRAVLAELGWSSNIPVIGYAGSFVDYEGLDLLIDALAILRQREVDFRALLIGDGAVHSVVMSHAQQRGLTDRVRFTGRVPHKEVDRLYEVIDICAYPRRLTAATAAVSPLKPFEAMALRKSVLLSDVPALVEIAGDQERALVFPHDDPYMLADALEQTIKHPEESEQRKDKARSWVERERSWIAIVETFAQELKRTALKENPVHG